VLYVRVDLNTLINSKAKNCVISNWKTIGLYLLFLVLGYSVFRWMFFALNLRLFPALSISEVTHITWGGFWFDWAIILYLNLPVIIIHIFPIDIVKYRFINWFSKLWFIVVNGIAFSIVCADLVFYAFNGKRIDIEVLGLLSSLPTLLGQFFIDYWYIFLLFAVVTFGLIYLVKISFRKRESIKAWQSTVMFILFMGFIVIGLRGGISNKRPISPVSAALYSKASTISLVTNSAFTFSFSLVNANLQVPNYFNDNELKASFPVEQVIHAEKSTDRKNVVLIIMESFSQKYVGTLTGEKSYTPHFDSLLTKGSYCTNSFANGRRSSQGLVALTTGIPALMNEPFLYSKYSGNQIMGLPQIMGQNGYATAFFNGSAKDILGWRQYISQVGFDNYYSLEDYPNKSHSDGHWGIYDHHMFDYMESFIDKSKGPFFFTLFSISAHHPYNVPKDWPGDTIIDENPAIKALRYSDWSLGRFFERVKDKAWFKNTVFVVTADHTLNGESFTESRNKTASNWYHNRVGLYAVPVFYINPSHKKQSILSNTVSHVDVSASILKWSGFTGKTVSWGIPMDELDSNHVAIQYVNGIYQAVNQNLVLLFDGESPMGLYFYKQDPKLENSLLEDSKYEAQKWLMLSKLKAAIQQHHQRMKYNQLLVKN
jgi:phosphoglycerol transferase MdoB-like AlkP superfamily enzyme